MNLNTFPITIKIIKNPISDPYAIYIPYRIYCRLSGTTFINFKVGSLSSDVLCFPGSSDSELFISQELSNHLCIYSNMKTNLKIRENQLCVGPVIGSFTDTTSVRIASENRPGTKIKSLNEANKDTRAILYFFSVGDFDYDKQMIRGTYYNYNTSRWEQQLFPLPDVLYDRGGSSLKKHRAESDRIRKVIDKNKNVKKFNPLFIFDKWDVHVNLNKYEDTAKYLPYTIAYRTHDDLLNMLSKSSVLYIKDRKGNRGLGVARVVKSVNNTFEISYYKKELFKFNFNSFDDLASKIDEVFNDKKSIIQSSIDVIKINNGNVDMRATVQRGKDGKLSITAYPVRVGKEGIPITSTRSGSEVYRFEDFFTRFFHYTNDKITALKSKIDSFLVTTYYRIEDVYGSFGEIGIDFAIDNNGEVWFIECNAKPGKDTVCLSYDDATIMKAFSNPLEYSKYLCRY
jgi:hypothetical protein